LYNNSTGIAKRLSSIQEKLNKLTRLSDELIDERKLSDAKADLIVEKNHAQARRRALEKDRDQLLDRPAREGHKHAGNNRENGIFGITFRISRLVQKVWNEPPDFAAKTVSFFFFRTLRFGPVSIASVRLTPSTSSLSRSDQIPHINSGARERT